MATSTTAATDAMAGYGAVLKELPGSNLVPKDPSVEWRPSLVKSGREDPINVRAVDVLHRGRLLFSTLTISFVIPK